MGMKPVHIALDGDTAAYLVLALKEELAGGNVLPTTRGVYYDVIEAIVAAMDPPVPELHVVEQDETAAQYSDKRRRSTG